MTALHKAIYRNLTRLADAPAINLGRKGSLSYAELAQWVAAIQQAIADHQTIGIMANRSASAYAAVLACFLSGKRFVPLNPEFPMARLQKVVAARNIDLLLFDPVAKEAAQTLVDGPLDLMGFKENADPMSLPQLDERIADNQIAYQLFTSGSTGEPKGVPISYKSLDHYISNIKQVLHPIDAGRFSQLFDLTFDLSMHDIFLCFASGGELVPAGKMDVLMPHSYIAKKKIDYWFSVPMLAVAAVRGLDGDIPQHKLKSAAFCGEALPNALATDFHTFLQDGATLWNLYGPTEATIAFTACRHSKADFEDLNIVPLGTPFGENCIAIETDTGEIIGSKEGVEGELLLGGPQVFDGYDPAVEKECFTGNASRFYRSGDRVRVDRGRLLHLGRTDDQIKIRGFRVELGDIEAAFQTVFGCESAVAVIVGEAERVAIAVAYVGADEVIDLLPLAAALPDYMRPSKILRIDKVPINVNGKVDRKAVKNRF